MGLEPAPLPPEVLKHYLIKAIYLLITPKNKKKEIPRYGDYDDAIGYFVNPKMTQKADS